MSGICWTVAVAATVMYALAVWISEAAAHVGAPFYAFVAVAAWAYLTYHHDGRRRRRDRTH